MIVAKLFTSLAATFGAYGLYKILHFLYRQWTSTYHILPSPPTRGWINGNLRDLLASEGATLLEEWSDEVGPTMAYHAMFGERRLYTTDLKAVSHVLANSTYTYQKPEHARFGLSQILGNGILVVEGDQHKFQRRIMNPAFGAAQVRELTEIFVEKSLELRDAFMAQADKETGTATVDVLSWLSRMTLDVIGLAGFNYKFDALTTDPEKNELQRAFKKIFESSTRISPIMILRALVPALRWIPGDRDAETKQARRTMEQIGKNLLSMSKAGLSGNTDKNSLKGKNLLTLLLRANVSTDLPEHQRMSDADVLAQVPTFLVAGHETTSSGTTWALFALSQNKEAQQKLREELLNVSTDNPTMDELNSLPYLDAVVREALRVHSPVTTTMRVAVKDDVIPFEVPFKGKDGKLYDSLPVRKGQMVLIPIQPINRSRQLWGDDSFEFRPERWQKVPEAVSGIPNVWGNTLTFLAGPHACIGYRFSVVETKAILFTLIRAFEFELGVPAEDIGKKANIVQRPFLRSNPEAGNQLPLVIKPVQVQ